MDTVELLPCPFCGGASSLVESTKPDAPTFYWIACQSCRSTAYSAETAIKQWNARTPPSPCDLDRLCATTPITLTLSHATRSPFCLMFAHLHTPRCQQRRRGDI